MAVKIAGISIIMAALIAGAFSLPSLKTNIKQYITKKTSDDYSKTLMEEFISEVKALPEDSKLYVLGWWQEPQLALFADIEQTNLYSINGKVPENSYLIVGHSLGSNIFSIVADTLGLRLIRVDTSEVDYSRMGKTKEKEMQNSELDLFAIYKIEQ